MKFEGLYGLVVIATIAGIVFLTCRAVFYDYFRQKGDFVDRLVEKQKRLNNAEE